jgi:integrase
MASKDTATYWKERVAPRMIKGKPSPTLYARLSHNGKQAFINLNTANKTTAANTAAAKWATLKKDGWEAVKPTKSTAETITIGEYIKQVEASHIIKKSTFNVYTRKLRTLAAEITGIPSATHYDKQSAKDRRDKIEKLPCSVLTADNVRKWKRKRLKGLEGEAERKALNTLNSILADARSLFGKKVAPEVNVSFDIAPLSGIVVSNIKSKKFEHEVDYQKLVDAAQSELKDDQLAVFLLAAGCGLRRSEIDRLRGEDIDVKAGTIRVTNTADGNVKRDSSVRTVYYSKDGIVAEALKGRGTNFYAICPSAKFSRNLKEDRYRCDDAMLPLIDWLRKQGVTETKAIHYLRKACGDVVARQHGIAVAANTLGNSIQVCHATYSDHNNTKAVL